MDQEALRLLIRRKLHDRRLPHDGFRTTWSTPSDGETCDACDTVLAKTELLMEGATLDLGRRPLQMHVRCFQIWDHERRAAGDGQVTAQREIVNSLQAALDARRQRILISQSSLNWVKSAGILLQAICTLFAIAMVHSDNRLTAALAVGLFATAAAVCLVMIVAHNRPFSGEISVRPDVLLQVEP